MFPLIHSRISSSEVVWPSLMQATAEITWPGVQKPHLKRVLIDERALYGVHALIARESLHGRHLAPVGSGRQHHAAVDAPPIQQHRAGSTLASVTALLGAGELETLAQQIQQRGSGIDSRQLPLDAVNPNVDGELLSEHPTSLTQPGRGRSSCLAGALRPRKRPATEPALFRFV